MRRGRGQCSMPAAIDRPPTADHSDELIGRGRGQQSAVGGVSIDGVDATER